MNSFIMMQITNITTQLNMFINACYLGAKQDDGRISRDEKIVLDDIEKATLKYIKELEKIAKR